MDDVADVVAFDQHVGFTDRIGLGVEFLTVHHQPSIRILGREMFLRN